MAAGVAFSRVTGLLREQTFAYLFGASAATDAFVAAFRIPNFFRDLLAENIASAAIVPSYIGIREKKGHDAAAAFSRVVLKLILLVSVCISIIGIFAARPFCAAVAGGFDPERFEMTVLLARWLFPFLTLISVAAFFQAMGNAEGRFFIPAVSTAGLNVAFIVAGWFLIRVADPPIVGMAWGALIGGLTAVLLLLPGYLRTSAKPANDFNARPEIMAMLKLALPVVLGVAATNINVLVNTLAASYTEEGAIAWLNFAYRVMHLPLGLIAVSLGTAALPMLSRAFESNDRDEYRTTISSALSYAIALTVPAALGMIALREDIIGVLYEHGSFTSVDTRNTGFALAAYAVGVPVFALNRILAPAFYARKEPGTAVRIGTISVAMNIVFNGVALWTGAGFFGIALSASAAGFIQTSLLLLTLRRRAGAIGIRKNIAVLAKTLFSSAIMLISIWAVSRMEVQWRWLRLFLEIGVGMAVYLAVARPRRLRKGA